MKEKQRLIKEIERASDNLVQEMLIFLLAIKNKTKLNSESLEKVDKSNHLTPTANSTKSLKSLLLEIPEAGEDADFERIPDLGRDINL